MLENEISQIGANVTVAALIVSLVVNLVQGAPKLFQWFYERKDKKELDQVEVFQKLIKAVVERLEQSEKDGELKDTKIKDLRRWVEMAEEKHRDSRRLLHEFSETFREIARRFSDEEGKQAAADLEKMIDEICEGLKLK